MSSKEMNGCSHTPKCKKIEAEVFNEIEMLSIWRRMPPLNATQNMIRLLTLHPAPDNAKISCTITAHSLSHIPEFEPISYTWSRERNHPPINSRVEIDGTDVHILPNLYLALRLLRYRDKPRVLWADYICIDQSNRNEKETQVSLMRQIYSRGTRTVVFLGEATEHDHKAMLLVSEIIQLRNTLGSHASHLSQGRMFEKATALRGFIKRVWFTRMWTVQEVVLARSAVIYSGEEVIPWDSITHAAWYLHQHRSCCTGLFQHCAPLHGCMIYGTNVRIRDPEDSWDDVPLDKLLVSFHNHKTSDPRDRIYALQPLRDSHRSDFIQPDYEICLPLLLRRVAMTLLRENPFRFLLQFAGSLSNPDRIKEPKLPSWAVDFSKQSPNFLWPSTADFFSACGNRVQQKLEFQDENTASIIGAVLDTVVRTSGARSADDLPSYISNRQESKMVWKRLERDLEVVANRLSGPGMPAHPIIDMTHVKSSYIKSSWAFYTTIACGVLGKASESVHRRIKIEDAESMAEVLNALIRYNHHGKNDSTFFNEQLVRTDGAKAYLRSLLRSLSYSRIFTTKYGRVGIGPRTVSIGDRLVIFQGGRVPFLLRTVNPLSQNETLTLTYHFLGPAYVHGIMDGGAVAMTVYDTEPPETKDCANEANNPHPWAPIYLV